MPINTNNSILGLGDHTHIVDEDPTFKSQQKVMPETLGVKHPKVAVAAAESKSAQNIPLTKHLSDRHRLELEAESNMRIMMS